MGETPTQYSLTKYYEEEIYLATFKYVLTKIHQPLWLVYFFDSKFYLPATGPAVGLLFFLALRSLLRRATQVVNSGVRIAVTTTAAAI